MKRGYAILVILISCLCSAETYFIRNSGAATQQGASLSAGGGCGSDISAMSVDTHNKGSYSPGDTIYICNAITSSVGLVPPSSGVSGRHINYRGDYPGHRGSLQQRFSYPSLTRLLNIQNKQYLSITGLLFDADQTLSDADFTAIWIEENYEPTGYIDISDCTFQETVKGVFMRGDVRYVKIIRSLFRDLTSNGVTGYKYYGRDDSLFPSFITVGGARQDGNTFINVGFLGCKDWKTCSSCQDNICLSGDRSGSVPGEAIGTRFNDLIFSYNHIYADKPGWGGGGVYLNGVNRVLIEYNYFHDQFALNRRGFGVKSDFSWKNSDIIIRFNRIGPTSDQGGYTDPGSAIRFNNCIDNIMVYGNLIQDVEGLGIFTTWGWDTDYSSDGCIPEDVFIYSNIIDRTRSASGIYMAGTSGTDHLKNVYVTNNLVYRAADDTVTEHPDHSYGIQMLGDDRNFVAVHVMNNVIDTPRDLSSSHRTISAVTDSDVFFDYNHHHFPGAIPEVYHKGSTCIPCEWNSSKRPNGYGAHDSAGDPRYVSAADSNFALTLGSPCINTGQSISVSPPSFYIQGKQYTFDLADGLHPSTDWTQSIPVVVTAKQSQFGNWEKGPYVYTGSAASYECSDNVDNDGDGRIDLADSGCASATDNDESDCGDGRCETVEACPEDCRRYTAKKVSKPVTINGDIAEFAAADAISLSNTRGTIGTYKLLWDDQYLYIGGQVKDTQLNALGTVRDSAIYSDDSIELFFDTLGDRGSSMNSNDYKIYANARNTQTDSRIYDTIWDSQMESASLFSGTLNAPGADQGYIFEIRVPLASLGSPGTWGFDLAMNDRDDSGSHLQTSWSNSDGGTSNNPSGWGRLVFSDEMIRACSSADADSDNAVSLLELNNEIAAWRAGALQLSRLMAVVVEWKNGC